MPETPDDQRNLGWRHFPAKRPHFFKVFLPMYTEELPIPRKFVRKFRKELADVVFLMGPSGTVWRVGLKETDGIVYFLDGWRRFIEYHSLCIGYMLVFRYDGNSQFNVQIFDKSACEKEYPYASESDEESCYNKGSCSVRRCIQSSAMKLLNSETKSKDNNKRKNTSKELLCQSESRSFKSGKSVGSENLQQAKPQDHLLSSQQSDCIKSIQSHGKGLMESFHKDASNCSKEKTQSESVPMVLENQRTDSCMPLSGRENYEESYPNKRSCTPEKESDDSIEILGVVKVEGRDLHRTARKDNHRVLRRSLRHYIQSNGTNMKINRETKSMDNNKLRNRSEALLSQSESRCSNSDKSVGSEDLQQAKPQDHLQSSRESGGIKSIQSNGKGLIESIHKNVSNCSKEKTQSELTPMDFNIQITESCMPLSGETFMVKPENRQTEPDRLSSSSEDVEYSQEQREAIMPINVRVHHVPKKRTVTVQEKQKALLEATKFNSDNPFFIAVMRPSYVCNYPRMYIPTNFVKDHLSSELRHVTLELADGRKWLVGCRYGQKGSLVLSRGWSMFLLESNIEEGDVCVFELVKRKKIGFKVTICPADEVMPLVQVSQKLTAKKKRSCN